MFYNYAVINNNKVVDVIVAETKEIAESLTGKTCIGYELKDHTSPQPGWNYVDGEFFPQSPHKSLTKFNKVLWIWEPGVDRPSDNKIYTWDLDTEQWIEKEQDPGTAVE